MLAQLQLKKEDYVAAAKTYEDLAKIPQIDKDIREEADLLGAEVLMKAKKFAEAKKKFEHVRQSLPASSPLRPRLDIYLIQCSQGDPKAGDVEGQLRAVIAKLSDKDPTERNLKALAYNTLGEYLLSKGKSREAFWQFMFVDVEYNQDRGEHKKALQHLWKLFEEFKDDAKAKQYKERYQKAS
jgi:tetratricopeptide (TPR) repeat protein